MLLSVVIYIICEDGFRTSVHALGETLHHAHRLLQDQAGPELRPRGARGRSGRRPRRPLIIHQSTNITIPQHHLIAIAPFVDNIRKPSLLGLERLLIVEIIHKKIIDELAEVDSMRLCSFFWLTNRAIHPKNGL